MPGSITESGGAFARRCSPRWVPLSPAESLYVGNKSGNTPLDGSELADLVSAGSRHASGEVSHGTEDPIRGRTQSSRPAHPARGEDAPICLGQTPGRRSCLGRLVCAHEKI